MHKLLASAAAATALAGLGVSAPALAQSGPPAPGGTYRTVCQNIQFNGAVLTAECKDAVGRYHLSTLPTAGCRGDIGDQNGMLACAGSTATGGQLVTQAAPAPAQDNRDRRDNQRDDRAAAAVAGAVAGALLGGPPPVYGDPRYGDPRYDPHYAEGGWGYGRRPGEWVAIRDRADWLEMRIDRAQREGRLSRGDARDLRRQLASIEDIEARDMRDGRLDPRERADLDRRFDELQRRINFESGPPDRGDRRDFRDRGDDHR